MNTPTRLRVLSLLALVLVCGLGVTLVDSVQGEYVEDRKPVVKPNFTMEGKPYQKYLCLDGGGLRGIIAAMILKQFKLILKNYILSDFKNRAITYSSEVEMDIKTVKDFHVDLADFFDGFAGISAGSWIATYLASKGGNGASKEIFSLAHIVNKYGSIRPGSVDGLEVFFMEYGRDIYPPTGPLPLKVTYRYTGFPKIALRGLAAPLYSVNGLEWVLKRFLGDTKLSEVSTGLLVCAFDLFQRTTIQFISEGSKNGKPANISTNVFITSSRPRFDEGATKEQTAGIEMNQGWDYYIRDITRASSAFPMINEAKDLKPLREIHSEFVLIDGAMVGNNPVVQTLVWASYRNGTEIPFQNIAIMSLGTGFVTGSAITYGDGGMMQWFIPMVELLLGATPEYWQALTDYMYYEGSLPTPPGPVQVLRIQPIREAGTEDGDALGGVGNPSNLQLLKSIGEKTSYQFGSYMREFTHRYIYGAMPDPPPHYE
eukprot:g7548.t1